MVQQMLVLQPGDYSGSVVAKQEIHEGIVTAASYLRDKCNSDWHSHENMHISFVFQGKGDSEVVGQPKPSGRDGVFTFNAGEKHRWVPKSSISKSVNVELHRGLFEMMDFTEEQVSNAIQRNFDTKFLMLKLRNELIVADHQSREATRALLLELVGTSSAPVNSTTPKWVNEIRDYLNDRWNLPVSLDDLAKAVDVHPVTISKSFRKYFCCTLGEYLRKLKIEKSIYLIKNSERSLTEVALFCGFADQSHFTRTFKTVTGFLPKEFRKV